MTLPTIHLNGTSAHDLLENYRTAMDAVRAAEMALSMTAPNGRDYYPQGPEAIDRAISDHCARQAALASVFDQLQELSAHCFNHVKA